MKQLFLSLCLFTLAFSLSAQDEFTLVKVGDTAPDFSVQTKDGKTLKLSELKGKVVWINFFATWCPPCRKELPYLQKEVYNKHKGNKDFLLLILGREHSWEELDKFAAEQKFNMPFYPDLERKVFSLYAKQNIPRNFIIDKSGKIALSSGGFEEKEFAELVTKMEKLLKE